MLSDEFLRGAWNRALKPLQLRGFEIFGGFSATAEPSGTMPREVYEALRDQLLEEIRASLPLDIAVLWLHGASVADGYEDCEGDILRRVRELVGAEAAVGAVLDPHCHISDDMMRYSDILIAYKEYPHVDAADRVSELVEKLLAIRDRHIHPVSAVCDCRMLSLYFTDQEPMRSFVDEMIGFEQRGDAVSISLAHGFPWADVPDVGTKVLVYANASREKAASIARTLGDRLFALRGKTFTRPVLARDAIRDALRVTGRSVLADIADNPGGGAGGDSTFLLRELLTQSVDDFAFGSIYDPSAVKAAMEVEIGAKVKLSVGGKISAKSGQPLDIEGVVVSLHIDYHAPMFPGLGEQAYGDAAVLRLGRNIDLVLTSLRAQVFARGFFDGLKVDLNQKQLIVVKSMHHFNQGFLDIADHTFYVETLGTVSTNFKALDYKRAKRPIWPLEDLSELP